MADPDALRALAKWGADNVDESGVAGFKRLGTSVLITAQSTVGGLPTHNWATGTFEGAEASVEMMLLRSREGYKAPFHMIDFMAVVEHREGRGLLAEATVKVHVGDGRAFVERDVAVGQRAHGQLGFDGAVDEGFEVCAGETVGCFGKAVKSDLGGGLALQ